MPKSKKQGLCLSLIMIYMMAALNMAIRLRHLSGEVWPTVPQWPPRGYIVGVFYNLFIVASLSLRAAQMIAKAE